MGENGTLSRKQRRFAGLLALSKSVREAAKAARIGETTAWQWLSDPTVRALANEKLDAVLASAAHAPAARMTQALETLAAIMGNDSAPASARVSAARCILETGLRYHDQLTLAERVSELERLMEVRDEKHRTAH